MAACRRSHRYGNATLLDSISSRHRQPLGQPAHRLGRRLHQGAKVRARRHRAHADRPGVRAGPRDRRPTPRGAGHVLIEAARDGAARRARRPSAWDRGAGSASAPCSARPTSTVPLKPQRVITEMNEHSRARHLLCHRRSASRRSRARNSCTTSRATEINCGQAGPSAGISGVRSACALADPERKIVALSGDYRLPVPDRGARGRRATSSCPLHIVGEQFLSRPHPARRSAISKWIIEVSSAFENINAPEIAD